MLESEPLTSYRGYSCSACSAGGLSSQLLKSDYHLSLHGSHVSSSARFPCLHLPHQLLQTPKSKNRTQKTQPQRSHSRTPPLHSRSSPSRNLSLRAQGVERFPGEMLHPPELLHPVFYSLTHHRSTSIGCRH